MGGQREEEELEKAQVRRELWLTALKHNGGLTRSRLLYAEEETFNLEAKLKSKERNGLTRQCEGKGGGEGEQSSKECKENLG